MASLPVFRRFTIADIPNSPEWLNTILGPLNLFCEQTVNAFDKNLTIGANVQGQKFSTTFTTLADYASGAFTPIIFQYSGNGFPNCCIIGQLAKFDGTKILQPYSMGAWTLNTNKTPPQVVISYIAGLEVGVKYNVTFVVL